MDKMIEFIKPLHRLIGSGWCDAWRLTSFGRNVRLTPNSLIGLHPTLSLPRRGATPKVARVAPSNNEVSLQLSP